MADSWAENDSAGFYAIEFETYLNSLLKVYRAFNSFRMQINFREMKNQLCKLNMFCFCSDSFSVFNSTWQSTPLYPNLVYIHCFLTSGNSVFQDYRQILDVFTTSTGSYEVTKQKVVGYLLSNILSLWYLTTRGIKNFRFLMISKLCYQLLSTPSKFVSNEIAIASSTFEKHQP